MGLIVPAGALYIDRTSGSSGRAQYVNPAPPFALQDSEGRQVTLADYLGQKPVLLVFWGRVAPTPSAR